MKRQLNQDHFLCVPDLATFVVCDGMGGHKGGETASLLAVKTVCDSIRAAKSAAKRSGGLYDMPTILMNALKDANRAVHEKAKADPELQGMGTTCTTLVIDKDKAYIGHVGDSRCYMVIPGRLWQLTRDHSLVQEKLRAGIITRDQVKTDRMKNVITRSVGFEPTVEVDVYQLQIHENDTFLLCSDGLSSMCDDSKIREIIEAKVYDQSDLDAAAKSLIDAANANGGEDNVTSILVTAG
jgi:protein phosphatase